MSIDKWRFIDDSFAIVDGLVSVMDHIFRHPRQPEVGPHPTCTAPAICPDYERLAWWREWFGFSHPEAHALEVLFGRASRTVPFPSLGRMLELPPVEVRRTLCVLVEGLDPGGMQLHDFGARLTALGMSECRLALAHRGGR